MNALAGIFLGLVQGLTEFLPVSSSGHLVLFQNLMGLKEPELLLDISLHLGTLFAVFIYFRSDLGRMARESFQFASGLLRGRTRPADIHRNPHASLALWVLVGTAPTLLIGLAFRSPLERLFGSVPVVGAMLGVTGLILALT
ncbi:MAG: undecaprenyl-diphosphate phosphatase, partial [Deltaproteobacteria bacterium]|nr:undecaprenyl-diphosphate phosphatase [Deltaproteobacteria bacterium]